MEHLGKVDWCSWRWVKPGVGVGDQWVKPGDWEMGDYVIELCFDYKLD